MPTYATMFTGGDGFGIGATAAGLTPTWGVEIDGQIAEWAERNSPGLAVVRSNVADVDYSALETPFQLHASPQCKNASAASSGLESQEDLSQSAAIERAIVELLPPVFTLENVWQYRRFQSFVNILGSLHRSGYDFDYWHLNVADFGVPQTRKRLILIARRDGRPIVRPDATHAEKPGAGLFGSLEPWVSWYEAIEDLIPGLPESEFAPWQLKRMPEELKENTLWSVGISRDHKGNEYENVFRRAGEPGFTVTGNSNQGGIRAYLVPGDNSSNTTIRDNRQPMVTVQTRGPGQCPHQAFIVGSQYGQPNTTKDRPPQTRLESEPYFSVTVSGGAHQDQRAYAGGRVVKMTPRALARFQSFPDWYELPEQTTLACTIIGNAVPPLLAQRICERLLTN
jgi:DNA (cytosine-5)-methyltransferase 1